MGVVIVNTYQHVIGYRLPVLIRLSSPFAEAESQLVTQTDHEGLFFDLQPLFAAVIRYIISPFDKGY